MLRSRILITFFCLFISSCLPQRICILKSDEGTQLSKDVALQIAQRYPNIKNDDTVTVEHQECCLDKNAVCLIYDPCLTRSNGSTLTFLAFLRGNQVQIKPYAVFSSGKSFGQTSDFMVDFTPLDDPANTLLISVTQESVGRVMIGAYRKTSEKCSYFNRLGSKGLKNFIVSTVIAAICVIATTALFIPFFIKIFKQDRKTLMGMPLEQPPTTSDVEFKEPLDTHTSM